ncbi:TetR/AcrR family transcriptional regulator [Falsiroseomonas selenitidurans]|uniref:TetR/AcrR family transcriptional regulator n=1 Tax=Falsiroseomonas selenitidurans TaxID=2716335 RepID=A0ABX1E802_9PROT|nr:TetR/AcrR family transcriptional regulator [Falsiroseomonas selenitidurans]NKC31943.1 TetR/AcrR family transcriptional regulator [Falsiroseomonas selenitidurans]
MSPAPTPRPRDAATPRSRDRDATARGLMQAAIRVLARDGFTALGPNAVAAEAGCDKKLIYRYFGGMDGLLESLGEDIALWLAGPPPELPEGAAYGNRIGTLLSAYAEGLRGDLALQRLLAWELAETGAPLRKLDAARSAAFGQWVGGMLRGSSPPAGVDAPAVNAVLLAALHYMTLARRSMGRFAGLDLATPEGQARLDAALAFLVDRAYGPAPEDAP